MHNSNPGNSNRKITPKCQSFFNNSEKHATEFFVIIIHCKCKMDQMLCLIDAVETYNALKKCLPPSLIL